MPATVIAMNHIDLDFYPTPAAFASQARTMLNANQRGPLLAQNALRATINSSTQAAVLAGPYASMVDVAFWSQFWKLLIASGDVMPTEVVLDVEDGPGDWNYSSGDGALDTAAINQCIGRNWIVADTFRQLTGYAIPVVGFEDAVPRRWAVMDVNGHQYPPVAGLNAYSVSGISAKSAYVADLGMYLNNNVPGLKLDKQWNSFIMCRNNAAACADPLEIGAAMTPWIQDPSNAFPNRTSSSLFLWSEMTRHLAAMGVTKMNVMYASSLAAVEAVMSEYFAAVPVAAGSLALNYVPFDSASVTTGGVTTTYDQFMAAVESDSREIGISV